MTETRPTPTATLDQIATYAQARNVTRFTDVDAVQSEALVLADRYAREYTGTFEYLVSMRTAARTRRGLSAAQARGVLNCALAEIRRRQPAEESTPEVAAETTPTPARPVTNGYYTVVNPDGSHVTLRLSKPKFGDFPEGTQVASVMAGSYNEGTYTGFAFVKGGRVNVWKRFSGDRRLQDALTVLLASDDSAALGRAYAVAAGRCWKCGRLLTTPESIAASMGPDCASRGE